jgi:hypothetical protein
MKTGKKVILISCLVLLLSLAVLAGAVFYYYAHPLAAKGLVEASLSRAIGASVAIRSLSCAIHPFHIAAKGVTVQAGPNSDALQLDLGDVYSEFSLEGPFGRKRLIVNGMKVKGLSCRIRSDTVAFETAQRPGTSSFFSSIMKRAFAFLIFRDLKLAGATLTDGAAVVQMNDQTLSVQGLDGRLTSDHRVEISCGAQFEWPSKEMHLLAPLIRMKTDGDISLLNAGIECSITIEDALFENPVAVLKNLHGGAHLVYRPGEGEVTFEDMNLTLQDADIKEGGWKEPVRLDLHLAADGVFRLNGYHLRASPLNLAMGTILEFSGELNAAVGTRKTIDMKVVDCRVTPQDLVPFLPAGLKKGADPVKLEGPIHLTGRIGGVEEETRWIWDADIEARLTENQGSYRDGDVRASGALTGSIEVCGRVPDMAISADLKAQRVLFHGNGIDAGPSEGAISFSGTYPLLDLKNLSARIPRVTARFQNKAMGVADIHLEAEKGWVNTATRAASLPEIRLNSSLLKNIRASMEAADGKLRTVEIQGKETGLAALAMGLDVLPSGWKLAGQDAVQVRVGFDEVKGVAVTSELALQGMAFQSSNELFVGENLSLKATVKAETDPSHQVITADIAMEANGGEALYDRFYVDMERNPLSCRCAASYHRKGREFQVSHLGIGLKDMMTCRMNGRVFEKGPAWHLDMTAHIPGTPVIPLFSLFAVEPFQAQKPILRTLQVEGTVSATVNLTGTSSAWAAKGSVHWNDGGVASEDSGISLRGIDLHLPLWIRSHDMDGDVPALDGKLSVDALSLPFIPEQTDLSFPLKAQPNTLAVASPTEVKIPGGTVRVGRVAISGRPGSLPSVHTDLTINRVDVAPLLIHFWPRPIQGTLTGVLNPIRVEGGRLTSSGSLTARMFGGEVILSDPGISGLFAGAPVFNLNARWKDVHLSELTADTSFGKIEGVVNGYAKDLEIAQGQVQKCDLLVETVPKKGVPQRISVKAVDNIAQIGGGQSPFIGVAGMFASVFKEFPYEKIGVRATLENDVFRINGTIREGDTEYLVKRGLFSGVNVVNQSPNNQVSFKDMIKRLKRIRTTQGETVIQ